MLTRICRSGLEIFVSVYILVLHWSTLQAPSDEKLYDDIVEAFGLADTPDVQTKEAARSKAIKNEAKAAMATPMPQVPPDLWPKVPAELLLVPDPGPSKGKGKGKGDPKGKGKGKGRGKGKGKGRGRGGKGKGKGATRPGGNLKSQASFKRSGGGKKQKQDAGTEGDGTTEATGTGTSEEPGNADPLSLSSLWTHNRPSPSWKTDEICKISADGWYSAPKAMPWDARPLNDRKGKVGKIKFAQSENM